MPPVEGATLAGVRALAFDAYGTLFDVQALTARLERSFGPRAGDVGALWRRKQLEYSWLRALMQDYRDFERVTEDALGYAVAALGLSLDRGGRRQLMDAYLVLDAYPEVPAALQDLSSKRRIILSNGSPRMLTAAVRHAGIERHFEALLSADAVKSYKVDPRVYRLAETHFGMAAGEILFCSSNAWDVAGAGAYGLRTCWLDRGVGIAESLGIEADLVVSDLSGLVEVLVGPAGAG